MFPLPSVAAPLTTIRPFAFTEVAMPLLERESPATTHEKGAPEVTEQTSQDSEGAPGGLVVATTMKDHVVAASNTLVLELVVTDTYVEEHVSLPEVTNGGAKIEVFNGSTLANPLITVVTVKPILPSFDDVYR
jgi:hypothetical protein